MKEVNEMSKEQEKRDPGDFTHRSLVQKKQKPLHALGPAQKHIPRGNVSAEMEEFADNSLGKGKIEH
jgi:hypothetical protein